ncbi:GL22831 [Drosophila persimilis]|uniref:GL22831 n=1 Tax=Drosophila persimilis TaxID=7234 RepID=B4GZK9_DROPE|nr:GL22831 [Drosophila persimilis]
MSPASFLEAKNTPNTEMHAVDLQLMGYVFDAIFSCIELYFGVFHTLWDRTMALYGNVGTYRRMFLLSNPSIIIANAHAFGHRKLVAPTECGCV